MIIKHSSGILLYSIREAEKAEFGAEKQNLAAEKQNLEAEKQNVSLSFYGLFLIMYKNTIKTLKTLFLRGIFGQY